MKEIQAIFPSKENLTSAYFEFVREGEYARCTLRGDWSVENNSGFEVEKSGLQFWKITPQSK